MKHPFLYIAVSILLVFIAACHKNKPNTIPTPLFDSTAYKDSVQHALDSIQHYNDSVTHDQDSARAVDSTVRHYFSLIIGSHLWNGTYSIDLATGQDTTRQIADTALTVDYGSNDTLRVVPEIGTTVFPQTDLRERIENNKMIIESIAQDPYVTYYELVYNIQTGAISYTYEYWIGHSIFQLALHTQ